MLIANHIHAAIADRDPQCLDLPPHLQPMPVTQASARLSRTASVLISLSIYLGMGSGLYGYHRYMLYLRRNIKSVSIILGHPEHMDVLGDGDGPSSRSREKADALDPDESLGDATTMAEAPAPEAIPEVVPDLALPPSLPTLTLQAYLPCPQIAAINHVPASTGTGDGRGRVGSGRSGGGGGGSHGQKTSWLNDGLYSGALGGETLAMEELEILHDEIPRYPPLARDKCISGDVMVLVIMDETGIPIDVRLVSAAHPLLVPNVVEAARLWRFKPAIRNGKKVKANFQICFRFIIPDL